MQEYSKVHADFVKINENNLIEIENILCTMLEYLLLKFSNSVLSVCGLTIFLPDLESVTRHSLTLLRTHLLCLKPSVVLNVSSIWAGSIRTQGQG